MPDLRLAGVHDDGKHLLLVDDGGARYLLAVDDALRAAVRRDRSSLTSLQPESSSGLRPRDVQAQIRAGATSEEVADLAGWSVDKVRRYEGPILAERAHVADVARRVRLRRRGGEPVLLGTEVGARLEDRGVAAASVVWDAWRTGDGPWTVVVHFVAGGRERQARWHVDLTSSAVTPVDDEARWLSEESASADGPAGGLRLAVSSPGVYDIEADGGVAAAGSRGAGARGVRSRDVGSGDVGSRDAGSRGAGSRDASSLDAGSLDAGSLDAGSLDAGSLDLVTAMRSRRREAGRGVPARPARTPVPASTDDPTAVPGSQHPAHQAARRRAPQREPLELDPTLMDDPPAAHPPASDLLVDVPLPLGEELGDDVLADEVLDEYVLGDEVAVADDGASGDLVVEQVAAEHVVAEQVVMADESVVEAERVDEAAVEAGRVDEGVIEAEVIETVTVVQTAAVIDVPADMPAADAAGTEEPAAEDPAADEPGADEPAAAPTGEPVTAKQGSTEQDEQPTRPAPQPAQRSGKPRSAGRSRNRRSSVPSWDDIMFGAKRD